MLKQLGTILFQILRSEIKIDFDVKRKIFRLTTEISHKESPTSVITYVERRKHLSFQPHQTSFHMSADNQVQLVQEIPFRSQSSLREQLLQFWQLAQHCHQMLLEMALEQKLEELKSR